MTKEFMPEKIRTGEFQELKKKGKLGQKKIEEWLLKEGFSILPMDFVTPYDDTKGRNYDWKALPKIPDGIARKENNIFFYETKTKSHAQFYVNVHNYKEYVQVLKILPVVIFFYIEDSGEIFSHYVEDKTYPIETMWDRNQVYVLDDHVNGQ